MTTHANFYKKTSLALCGRMNVANEPLTDCKHAVALLRGLNMQREFGQFCDCVIQLQINPGRLFLAHKSVLAASSPVLASLITSQGALLDLQSPCLSPETMEYLLDFIYTGKLPPKSQEDSVLSVAVDLQMQELQYALIFRRSTLSEFLNIQDKLNRKRPFPEEQHEEGNRMSPSFPHGSKRPLPSCLSCEAVPVICHASACRKLSPMQESSTPNYDLDIASDLHGRESDSSQSVHLPSYRHKLRDHNFQNMDKNDDNSFEPVSKKAKVVSHVLPSDVLCHQTETPKDFEDELLESGSEAFVKTSITVSPKTACVSTQIRHARHQEEDLSPHAKASRGLVLSDASRNDGCHGHLHLNNSHYEHNDDASHQFRLAENDHGESHASLEFLDVSDNIPVDNSHCISEAHAEAGQRNVLCHLQSEDDQPYTVHVAISREKYHQAVDLQTCRSSSDSKSLFDLDRCNAQGAVVLNHSITADTPVVHESTRDDRSSTSETSSIDQEDDYDLFGPQISSMHTYLGQVRYHCISREPQQVTGSSDSDEEGLYTTPADTGSGKHGSVPGIPLSDASASEPSMGTFDLGKAQVNPGLNLVAQPYQCTMCDRAFSQRGSLNRHMRSHLGVRPYSCPQCPMTFSRQYRVTEHMRVHQRGCEDLQRAGPT
ncbi:uncharacterized protein LOC143123743 [Alosa pseudoharengus]|uniref:uncharacterized protein LOC143123743 n=1 Tax=Alosa pseudoharengus TaxID=34774 RepID=UPI003F893F9B